MDNKKRGYACPPLYGRALYTADDDLCRSLPRTAAEHFLISAPLFAMSATLLNSSRRRWTALWEELYSEASTDEIQPVARQKTKLLLWKGIELISVSLLTLT